MQHGSDQLCQVQPDVGDVYRHVFSHLQDLLEPEETHTVHTFQGLKDEEQVQNDSADGKIKQHGTLLTQAYGK